MITLAAPRNSMKDYFYKNADADELLFVHEGSGTLQTMYQFDFGYGDYLLIPAEQSIKFILPTTATGSSC
jgi:homogentisate 1,2-dioxygenase